MTRPHEVRFSVALIMRHSCERTIVGIYEKELPKGYLLKFARSLATTPAHIFICLLFRPSFSKYSTIAIWPQMLATSSNKMLYFANVLHSRSHALIYNFGHPFTLNSFFPPNPRFVSTPPTARLLLPRISTANSRTFDPPSYLLK